MRKLKTILKKKNVEAFVLIFHTQIFAYISLHVYTSTCVHIYMCMHIHDVMVTVIGNGHSDTSSNPGQVCLHFK